MLEETLDVRILLLLICGAGLRAMSIENNVEMEEGGVSVVAAVW